MRKIITIVTIVLLLGLATLYFYNKEVKKVWGNPYITGNIYDIANNRVLVAEGFDENDEYGIMVRGKAIWLTITEDTEIIKSEGEEFVFDDLEIGMQIDAWTTGVIMESYPEQGTAVRIIIIVKNREVAKIGYLFDKAKESLK